MCRHARWSTAEAVHERPGHFWVAQAPANYRAVKIEKRTTIAGTLFAVGDIMVKIGRYFDRDVADPSGLTFEEWQAVAVFSEEDEGKVLTIAGGAIKLNRTTRPDVCWGDYIPQVNQRKILKVDSSAGGWVELEGSSRFRNPPTAGDFVVNATELRAVNFTMTPVGRPLPLNQVTVRKSGRLSAVVSVPPAPLPKRYTLDTTNDNEIRAKCW